MGLRRPDAAVHSGRVAGNRRRPCKPFFLLLLISALAGVVVIQEMTMRSATHTETFYRKALFTVGDKRGRAVEAKYEEITTTQTFGNSATRRAAVESSESEEAQPLEDTLSTDEAAQQADSDVDSANSQQQQAKREQDKAEFQQAAVLLAAKREQQQQQEGTTQGAGSDTNTQFTQQHQQHPQALAGSHQPEAVHNQQVLGSDNTKEDQRVAAATAAEQQHAAMAVNGDDLLEAAAVAAAEKKQAAAAAFAVEQATMATASEREKAFAAADIKPTPANSATSRMDQEVAEDEVVPLGPIEMEWWSAVKEPRVKKADIPHGVTLKLVQPDALRDPQDLAAAAQAATAASMEGAQGCKIYVLDAAREFGPLVGAPICDVNSPFIWPFASAGHGIDGAATLNHEDSQYGAGHWIAKAIKGSEFEAADLPDADFVYVDMHCYHTWWMSWHHPFGNKNLTDPTRYIQRTYEMLQDMPRFIDSRGADFGLLQPAPALRGIFSEAVLCEDLASVYHLVPERSSLCVWTRDRAERGKALVVPYVATTDLALQAPDLPRDIFLYFRGGCGSTDPSVRDLFAAAKMLRYWMVEHWKDIAADVEAACSCDICEGHQDHSEVLAKMRRSVFCPIVASNVQSSRRLSEAVLSGCIPEFEPELDHTIFIRSGHSLELLQDVFMGPPFHSVPLVQHVNYTGMSIFLDINDTDLWINRTSRRWEHNHMISKTWKLDDSLMNATVSVPSLKAVLGYLRALPAEVVKQKQDVLLKERLKFYYPSAPDESSSRPGQSILGDIIVGEMCARGAEAKLRREAAATVR